MQALRFHAPGRLPVLEEVPIPTPGPQDALLRVNTVALCGSDLHIIQGHTAVGFTPITLGHEIAADVVALGSQATESGVSVGDRVFVNEGIGCGECEHCCADEPNFCPNKKILGIHLDGGAAEYCVAPARNLTVMPRDIDPAEIAMIEPASTAHHALRELRLDHLANPTILLIGAGGVGTQVLQLARYQGMKVIVVDVNEAALQRAERAGASGIVNSAESEDALDDVLRLAGGRVDGAVDCVGFPQTVELALGALKPGRSVSVIGIGDRPLATTPPGQFIRSSLRITGIYAFTPRDVAAVSRAVAERAVTLSNPDNRRFPLSQARDALELFSDRKRAPARVLLEIPPLAP